MFILKIIFLFNLCLIISLIIQYCYEIFIRSEYTNFESNLDQSSEKNFSSMANLSQITKQEKSSTNETAREYY